VIVKRIKATKYIRHDSTVTKHSITSRQYIRKQLKLVKDAMRLILGVNGGEGGYVGMENIEILTTLK